MHIYEANKERNPEAAWKLMKYIQGRRALAKYNKKSWFGKLLAGKRSSYIKKHLDSWQYSNVIKPAPKNKYGHLILSGVSKAKQLRLKDQSKIIKEVPLDNVYSSQDFVGSKELKAKMFGYFEQMFGAENPPQHAIMLYHNNKHYLIDGNHRVSAARLLGKKTIKAAVFHLPQTS